MAGHVTLNDLEYRTNGFPRQVLANQMAAKVGQGESKYADLESWSAWIQQNWRGGAGHVNPQTDGDGFLWSTSDTRVPKQAILPPLLQFSGLRVNDGTPSDAMCWGFQTVPGFLSNIDTVEIDGASNEKVAMRFESHDSSDTWFVQAGFYALVPYGVEIKISIYEDDSGAPDALLTSVGGGSFWEATMLSYDRTESYEWCCVTLGDVDAGGELSPNTFHWLVAEVVGTGTVTFMTTEGAYTSSAQFYDGSSWSTLSETEIPFVTSIWSPPEHVLHDPSDQYGVRFFRLGGTTYMQRFLHFYSWDGTKWEFVLARSNRTQAGDVFGPYFWFSEVSGGYYRFDGSSVTEVSASDNYDIIHNDGKYLWVTDNNLAWYSADGTTFVGDPDTSDGFAFGNTDASIRGIARLEDNVYFSTDKFLYYIAPGDFVVPLTRWGSESSDNGLNMIEYQGAIYIPANGRLFRYSPDGTMQDVWLDLEDDLPLERIGRIDAMEVMNSWLVVYVSGKGLNPRGCLMVLQGQSWHTLTTLPNEDSFTENRTELALFYDRAHSRLWLSMQVLGPLYLEVPDFAVNPYNLTNYLFMPRSWMEWSFWEGPILEEQKDFESITIIGEGFDANNYVDVYFQEDGDTEWTLHGTATGNITELRWDDLATRVTGTRIKLGLLVASNDSYVTPKIEAIRLKYHLMTRDWFAWNLNIEVAGDLLLPDGTRSTRTAATIKDELDTLSKRVKPFIYRDVDSKQYEVKIKAAEFQYRRYEDLEGADSQTFEGIYHLTLEQVTEDEFTP